MKKKSFPSSAFDKFLTWYLKVPVFEAGHSPRAPMRARTSPRIASARCPPSSSKQHRGATQQSKQVPSRCIFAGDMGIPKEEVSSSRRLHPRNRKSLVERQEERHSRRGSESRRNQRDQIRGYPCGRPHFINWMWTVVAVYLLAGLLINWWRDCHSCPPYRTNKISNKIDELKNSGHAQSREIDSRTLAGIDPMHHMNKATKASQAPSSGIVRDQPTATFCDSPLEGLQERVKTTRRFSARISLQSPLMALLLQSKSHILRSTLKIIIREVVEHIATTLIINMQDEIDEVLEMYRNLLHQFFPGESIMRRQESRLDIESTLKDLRHDLLGLQRMWKARWQSLRQEEEWASSR